MELLVRNFNIHTVDNIMCRNLMNVNWNGKIYDCDFNQQLEMEIKKNGNQGNRCVAQVPIVFMAKLEMHRNILIVGIN